MRDKRTAPAYCIILLIIIGTLLCSCGPSSDELAATSVALTTAAATSTPFPSPTPTPEPICIALIPDIEEALSNVSVMERGEPSIDEPWIMAHFMPWYQANPSSGEWGSHWTMNHFNPNAYGANYQREIASHFYPLTGPYDSSSPRILEYQVLLMKISGIDGVIVNWYSHENFADYPPLNRATHDIFSWIEKAGLSFSLCYADNTVQNMVNFDFITQDEMIPTMQNALLYMERNWFGEEAHMTIEGRPVLLMFPSNTFEDNADWSTALSVLDPQPMFFSLHSKPMSAAIGAYNWVPMYASYDGVLSWSAMVRELNDFYYRALYWKYHIAGAWPGDEDIYAQAGVMPSYGYLDPRDGETFEYTLDEAFASAPIIVQLETWNDYGEGTIIEPTVEFGYQYLEMVQNARQEWIEPTFNYTPQDLHLPIAIYELREYYLHNGDVNDLLDRAFELIVAGNMDLATEIVNCISQLDDQE